MNQRELRGLVARMQEQVTLASSPTPGPTPGPDSARDLAAAWDALVHHLAIPEAPETRSCPSCGREIMRAATLCGHCWTKLGEPGSA
jgi:hypothetical protein